MSDKTSEMIDVEVKKLVDQQYLRCKSILESKRELVEALRDLLLAKQTITYPDIKAVLGPRQWAIKAEYSKYVESKADDPVPESIPAKVDSDTAVCGSDSTSSTTGSAPSNSDPAPAMGNSR